MRLKSVAGKDRVDLDDVTVTQSVGHAPVATTSGRPIPGSFGRPSAGPPVFGTSGASAPGSPGVATPASGSESSGVSEVLYKPVSRADLVRAVRGHLDGVSDPA